MFIAIVQILIYAGAIMVLFLFVVTMLAPEADDAEWSDRHSLATLVAGILGLVAGRRLELSALHGNARQ